jgi:cysteine-rich repeat protein
MTPSVRWPVLWATLASGGCVIEKIDAVIAEHGVTYWPSSTGDEGGSSTSTSTGTSTTDDAGTAAGGHSTQTASTAGTDTTEGTGSSTTGPIGPVCGDGVVEGGEACDDGNAVPNDGCKDCARDSIVFISSETYRGYELGGLDGADQRCRSLAAKAGLLRPETFRAWLSTQGVPAADRITHSSGRYTLVNGLVIAQDWASLTSGALNTTITVDENSQTQDSRAWTGTLADGKPALGSEFCSDWDDDSGLIFYGGAGRSLATDSGWSFYSHDECGGLNRLYCFEN